MASGFGTGRVLSAIDDAALPLHEMFGVAQRALRPDVAEEPGSDAELDRALGDVDAVLARVDWQVTGDAPARRSLARTLVSLRRLGWQVSVDDVVRYANAIDPIAADEVEAVDGDRPRTESVERMVVGTVLLESVLADLRLLAHEHHSGRRARRKGLTARRGARPRAHEPRGEPTCRRQRAWYFSVPPTWSATSSMPARPARPLGRGRPRPRRRPRRSR